MKIQLLKDTISYLTSQAESILSEEQKQLYLRINDKNITKKVKIRREQFANINWEDEQKRTRLALKLALKLPSQYKLDNCFVVSHLSPASARHIWDYQHTHVFLNAQDCLRIGLFFAQDLYHCLVLVLKGKWEVFYNNQYQTISAIDSRTEIEEKNKNQSLEIALSNAIKFDFQGQLRHQFRKAINEEISDIYQLFEEHGGLITEAGYELNTFTDMVKDCLNEQLYLGLINAHEIDNFAQGKKREMHLLLEGSYQEKIKYLEVKKQWQISMDELLEGLYILDRRKLYNQAIKNEFLAIFGATYHKLSRLKLEIALWQHKIQLKLDEPELCLEDIHQILENEIKQIKSELENLEKEIILSKVYTEEWQILDQDLGSPMQQDEIEAYFAECKQVFREISLKIHPDLLEQNDDFLRLAETEKERVKEIYAQVLIINREELVSNNKLISYRKRSLSRLQRASIELDYTLKRLGIMLNIYQNKEFDPNETIAEKITWYQSEAERLQEVTQELTQELETLIQDSEIVVWEEILNQKNHYEEINIRMTEQSQSLAKKANQLEDEFKQLFL